MRLLPAILLSLLLFSSVSSGQDREYQIKAEFLERFTRFVEWPPEAGISNSSGEFKICIIGKDPFGPYLTELATAVKIQNKKIVLRNIDSTRQIDSCNLLFVSQSEKLKLSHILEHTRSKPILTVGDSPGFGERGVLINFYQTDGFIRFEINRTAAERSRLRFSSRLLKLGRLIETNNPRQTP